jgi:N-acetylmuramoyl-L-alanine amidase
MTTAEPVTTDTVTTEVAPSTAHSATTDGATTTSAPATTSAVTWLASKVIVIDPGHQAHADSALERPYGDP